MKSRCDLILIHPPSMYDFREKKLHYGPVSDFVPSSPVFDLYPIGFLSMLSYLAKRGFKVQIVNLAAEMLLHPTLDVEGEVKKLDAEVYGIDFHWLPHVQGALEVARIVKKLHPDKKVAMGGLSSTIFWREILDAYKYVDYILMGDTAELPMLLLLENLIDGGTPVDSIPNLAWRRGSDGIESNGVTFVPESLDEFTIDYEIVIKEGLKGDDFHSCVPFAKFMSEPIGASLTYKGCIHDCVTCGGSRYAYRCFFRRRGLGMKSPEKIFDEVKSLSNYMRIPIFILGDLQLIGKKRVEALTRMLHEEKLPNILLFEFFHPPTRRTLSSVMEATDEVVIQLSPETQDENVRRAFGKRYNNRSLLDFIRNVIELNVKRLDLYFMIGLPKQDYSSATSLTLFIEQILNRFPNDGRIDFFSAPLAPFLDPGSRAFTDPGSHGYTLLLNGVEEHVETVSTAKSWGDCLNYETAWMSRDELVKATYHIAEKMLNIKIEKGIVGEDEGAKTLGMIRRMRGVIDPGETPSRRLTDKETVSKGELYPTGPLLRSARPRLLSAFITSWVRRRLNGIL